MRSGDECTFFQWTSTNSCTDTRHLPMGLAVAWEISRRPFSLPRAWSNSRPFYVWKGLKREATRPGSDEPTAPFNKTLLTSYTYGNISYEYVFSTYTQITNDMRAAIREDVSSTSRKLRRVHCGISFFDWRVVFIGKDRTRFRKTVFPNCTVTSDENKDLITMF
jgi:hypothetical protein